MFTRKSFEANCFQPSRISVKNPEINWPSESATSADGSKGYNVTMRTYPTYRKTRVVILSRCILAPFAFKKFSPTAQILLVAVLIVSIQKRTHRGGAEGAEERVLDHEIPRSLCLCGEVSVLLWLWRSRARFYSDLANHRDTPMTPSVSMPTSRKDPSRPGTKVWCHSSEQAYNRAISAAISNP
jgi:hypothetical protein